MSDGLRHISEALQRVRERLKTMRADEYAIIENELDIVETGVADLAARAAVETHIREVETA